MQESQTDSEVITRFAEAVDRMSDNLASWTPFFERLNQMEKLRLLALGQSTDITSATVRSIIAARRLRDKHFWPAMSEAVWTLLLELFAAGLVGECLDEPALAPATGLAPDEVGRWIGWLVERRMAYRSPKLQGAGAGPVGLTDEASDRMRAYLLASIELSPWVA